MDYEKKYKEIVGQIKKAYLYAQTDSAKAVLEEIIPELKESEDERIRKGLIKAVSRTFEGNKLYGTDVTREEALAWLEKKGRQKPVVIIPKFRIGDNIKTTNEEPLTITKIDGKGYWSEDLFICGFDDAAKWELVEQKPVWSEEDEIGWTNTMIMIKEVASHHYTKDSIKLVIDWLKSLKE